MARVTGPLMSQDASGTFAKAMTFGKWKGRNYVRRHAIPANPKSVLQVAVRAMMKFLSQTWNGGIPNQTSWDASAAAQKISAFNAFVQENLMRWKNADLPLQESGTNPTPSVVQTPTAVKTTDNTINTVDVSAAGGVTAWGWVLYYKDNAAPSGTLGEVIAVIEANANAGSFVHRLGTSTLATQAHYKAVEFDDDGVPHPISADVS